MKTELENNKFTSGFTTPIDYFDNISDRIVEKINGEATTSLIPKTSGFSVPEDSGVQDHICMQFVAIHFRLHCGVAMHVGRQMITTTLW